MTGCEACSALVSTSDAYCATCGADLRPARSRSRRSATARIDIPVRRYGRAPRPPRPVRSTDGTRAAHQRVVLLAAVMAPALAGALAALLLFG